MSTMAVLLSIFFPVPANRSHLSKLKYVWLQGDVIITRSDHGKDTCLTLSKTLKSCYCVCVKVL